LKGELTKLAKTAEDMIISYFNRWKTNVKPHKVGTVG